METLAESGIMLFVPKVYDIVWSAIILVIVALFFYKFFLPKFQAVFDERAAKIEGGIAKAEQAQKDADEAKAKYEAQLSNARVEASKIRDDARAEASHIVADARSPCGGRRQPDHRQRTACHRIAAAAGSGLAQGRGRRSGYGSGRQDPGQRAPGREGAVVHDRSADRRHGFGQAVISGREKGR